MSKPTISDEQVTEHLREGWGRKRLLKSYQIGTGRINRLKLELARKGVAPEHGLNREAAPGYALERYSPLVDGETGETKLTWYRYNADKVAQHELMMTAIEAMSRDLPRAKPIATPAVTSHELCNLYTLTDCHIGEYAATSQGGGDWDLTKAESIISHCFGAMIEQAPKAEHCVINQMGDFLHWDSLDSVTPRHKHPLEGAGLYSELVDVGITVMRKLIAMALAKHKSVKLIIAEGNHDETGSLWMRKMMAAMYESEPRLTVDTTELPFYAHRHGAVMLGFHHGHKVGIKEMPGMFADLYDEMWGATKHRHSHTGHYHKEETLTLPGMVCHRHPTLSATGTYAGRLGHKSRRRAIGITYHDEFGRVGSNDISPEMLKRNSRESA